MSDRSGSVDTRVLRAAFVQAHSQILNNGVYTPVVVIDQELALALLDELDTIRGRWRAAADVSDARARWMHRAATVMGAVCAGDAAGGTRVSPDAVRSMRSLIGEYEGDDR